MTATITRRTVLKTTGAAALAAALGTALAGQAGRASAIGRAGLTALRERWVDQITGRTLIDPNDADFKAAIATLDRGVAATVAKLASGKNRTAVFTLPLNNRPLSCSTAYATAHCGVELSAVRGSVQRRLVAGPVQVGVPDASSPRWGEWTARHGAFLPCPVVQPGGGFDSGIAGGISTA